LGLRKPHIALKTIIIQRADKQRNMSTLFYIILIAIIVIAGAILIPKMRSNGEKLGNEKTEAAEKMGRDLDPQDPVNVPFEKATIRQVLEMAWDAFQDTHTADIVEIDTNTTGCQLSMENDNDTPCVVATYVFKVGLDRLMVPDYIRERFEGDFVQLKYAWPEEKEQLRKQIQEALGGTIDSYVRYHYWHA